MAKYKVDGALHHVECRSCGQPRPLDAFRLFSTSPKRFMDFCIECEKREGTLTLYRRFNAYGTKDVVDEVFRIARIPADRRSAEQARILVEPKPDAEPETNEELIQREIARRDLARRRLVYFTTTMMPSYLPGWVHQDICRRLERFMRQVEAGQSPRLMLALPPRAGKSQLASAMFPAWILGHHPDWPIIISSYAQELPIQFSREIRDRLKDPEYQAIFSETRLRPDSQGVEAWRTTKDGGIKAAGVGVGLTGFGGRIMIADDLLKDAEAAASEVIRKNTFDWYQTVFRTRLAPGGGLLLIGTRWHWHDPAGRLLEIDEQLKKAGVPDYERENWEVINYPAIAEHDEFLLRDGSILKGEPESQESVLRLLRRKGEALHPERYPLGELLKIKHNTTTSHWSALYQQHPTPEEGDFFKRDDIKYRWLDPAYRPLTRTFMCVDYAIGQKQRNDFTVMGVYALDADDDLYCLEKRRGRWGTDDIVSNAVALVEKYKPEVYAGERGQIHAAVWPVIEKALNAKRLYISVDETLVPIQDKETRARPLQGRMQRGKFFYSYDSATRPDVYDINERELLQFPNGAHDDCVDCDAWAARMALNTALPNAHSVPKKHASWKDKLDSHAVTANSFMAA
jgi:predicted phage terminase large subunit-like protein